VVRFLLIAVPFLLCNIARGQSSDRKSEDLANFVFEDALVVLTIDDLSALTKSIQSHELFSQLTEQTKSTDPFSILLNWLSAKVYVGLHRNQAIEKSGFSREEVSDAFTGFCSLSGLGWFIFFDHCRFRGERYCF
jgi:hypothetical protein